MTKQFKPNYHPILRPYLHDVKAWHGYVRFLGLPTLKSHADIPMDNLYVSQSISNTYLNSDKAPTKEQLENPIQQLLDNRRLVVLGDPGCGKSTLINYFAWHLSSGFVKKLPGALEYALPIPMILRDLALAKVNSFDDLIDAFLKRPVAAKLNKMLDEFKDYLHQGHGLFLIDGLDEVGAKHRKRLRDIILQGFKQYPDCHFLCTSRIVGYDEAPLTFRNPLEEPCLEDTNKIAEPAGQYIVDDTPFEPKVSYSAPFTDDQISRFAQRWYAGQGSQASAEVIQREFILAVRANEATTRLARTPNLLTMMALIFKIRSKLPNGRALLYDDIAQAYLESIDTARKLSDPIPWQKKKIWLARVGFEMQMRRQEQNLEEQEEQELLISHADILCWIKKAMEDTGDLHDDDYAERYLDWITRRSGLLLPRGEDQFAFMHLSFQEYFAAVYIQFQMQNPAWLDDEEDEDDLTVDTRVNKDVLATWANTKNWQQSLIFLFELFDGQQGWSNRLWRYCFRDEDFTLREKEWHEPSGTDDSYRINATIRNLTVPLHVFDLQISLLSNPHACINDKSSKVSLRKLVKLALGQQSEITKSNLAPEALKFLLSILSDRDTKSLLAKLLLTEALQKSVITILKSMMPIGESTLEFEGIAPEIIAKIG